MPFLVARFRLNLRQLVAQRLQDRLQGLIDVRSMLQPQPTAGQPALRFERGDCLHQRLAANVCLAHTCYYINSLVRTRT